MGRDSEMHHVTAARFFCSETFAVCEVPQTWKLEANLTCEPVLCDTTPLPTVANITARAATAEEKKVSGTYNFTCEQFMEPDNASDVMAQCQLTSGSTADWKWPSGHPLQCLRGELNDLGCEYTVNSAVLFT